MVRNEERRSGLAGASQVQRIVQRSVENQAAQAAEQTDGRGRPGHSGQKGVDNRGVSKKTYPLPLFIQALIEEMAQAENVPQADIVAIAVVAFQDAWRAGRVDLDEIKIITYSEKQPWRGVSRLDVPEEFSFFSD
jgi:hypothetical protein